MAAATPDRATRGPPRFSHNRDRFSPLVVTVDCDPSRNIEEDAIEIAGPQRHPLTWSLRDHMAARSRPLRHPRDRRAHRRAPQQPRAPSQFKQITGYPMENLQRYRFRCTLTFGDIYGQIMVWLIVIFLSLASAVAMMGMSRPVYALATVGLILVLSVPFLLFTFVTTLINHIEVSPMDEMDDSEAMNYGGQPAQAM